jgi:hypothetical protein
MSTATTNTTAAHLRRRYTRFDDDHRLAEDWVLRRLSNERTVTVLDSANKTLFNVCKTSEVFCTASAWQVLSLHFLGLLLFWCSNETFKRQNVCLHFRGNNHETMTIDDDTRDEERERDDRRRVEHVGLTFSPT